MVQYLLWQDRQTGAYGVCALDQDSMYGLITASTIWGDYGAQQLVQALNRRQLPIHVFRERLLMGGIYTFF